MGKPDSRVISEASDQTLLRNFRSGQHDAATELYVRYASRLLALADARTSPSMAARFDPEDVVQSVFRTFFRRASEGLYEVPPGEELWQLFLVIAINKVRALSVHHKAQKRDVTRTNGSPVIETYSGARDETPLQVLRLVLAEFVDQLPAVQRRIFEMRIEGFEVNQIAEETQRSKRTVERVLQRFRFELAQLVGDEDEPD